jgi:SAM-dependent methyltransferase
LSRKKSRHTAPVTRADTKWTHENAGRRYAGSRFGGPRAAGRDPKLVGRLLGRFALQKGSLDWVLDLPSGTGRLGTTLAAHGRRIVAADLSASMLAEVPQGPRLRAHALALPFPDRTFDAVVCCRLLHHLDDEHRRAALGELVRVSRGLVLASFWDSGSWHAWRRRTGRRRAAHPDSRRAVSRATLIADLEAVGARPLGFAASCRFISPQTFVAAEVHGH